MKQPYVKPEMHTPRGEFCIRCGLVPITAFMTPAGPVCSGLVSCREEKRP